MMYINSLFIGINIRSSFECAKKVQHEKKLYKQFGTFDS